MAYVTHISGDQLSQTRVKARANFEEVIATTAVVSLEVVRSGMGLAAFRDACRRNFEVIDAELGSTTQVIDDGDMLWTVREKLNFNFIEITVGV